MRMKTLTAFLELQSAIRAGSIATQLPASETAVAELP
jgi:hypothetical protein